MVRTHLDPEPKVGPRHLDLFRLYKRVTAEGGYDKVSDTKGNKLAWRRIATEFLPGNANVVQLAFLVKSAYYRNLAYAAEYLPPTPTTNHKFSAYEISTFHKREPPPKEILEDVSAKGGDLLNRTLENYLSRSSREPDRRTNGQDSSDEEEHQKTPSQEKMEVDEPGSASGRVTRCMFDCHSRIVVYAYFSYPSTPSSSSSACTFRNRAIWL